MLLPGILISFILFTGCLIESKENTCDEPHPGDENVTRVRKTVSGGSQCDPVDDSTPPDTNRMLNKYDITVYKP